MIFKQLEMSAEQHAVYTRCFELDGCTYDPSDCVMIKRKCKDTINKVGLCIGSEDEDWCLFCGKRYELERAE